MQHLFAAQVSVLPRPRHGMLLVQCFPNRGAAVLSQPRRRRRAVTKHSPRCRAALPPDCRGVAGAEALNFAGYKLPQGNSAA